MHYDRDCAQVHGAHFHRLCPCGHEWLERESETGVVDELAAALAPDEP